jgi:tripeptide aminopeptidase
MSKQCAKGTDCGKEVEYTLSENVAKCFQTLTGLPEIKAALDFLEKDQDLRLKEQVEINEIPASPFDETERAQDYVRRFEALGLGQVEIDDEGNVLGLMKGSGQGPKLVVCAHLDTVFPKGYDPTVRVDENGVMHAPGISDDVAGLAVLLSVVRAFKQGGLQTVGDLLFVGTVGEEGLGDLRGSKHLFKSIPDISGFIAIDGDGSNSITYLALGSNRFEFTFSGPGGHSYGAFGKVPSPVHAMGRAIAKIADLKVPEDPRTTFTVSVVKGGTSVNSIASEAVMQTDTRSTSPEQLEKTVSELVNCVRTAVLEENQAWGIAWDSQDNITLDINKIGDRPSGDCRPDALHVQAAYAATQALGLEPKLSPPSSTDSSIPIFLGVPAVTLGRGGKGMNAHSPAESYDPAESYLAPQRVLLTILSLAGMAGKVEPLLGRGSAYNLE